LHSTKLGQLATLVHFLQQNFGC